MLLRKVHLSDCETLFTWINDMEVRKNARYTDVVSIEDFTDRFIKELESENVYSFIVEKDSVSIGQLKLSKDEDRVVFNYSVDKNYRGQGLGTEIVKQGEKFAKSNINNINKFVAYVRGSNKGSCKIFKKLNYTIVFSNDDYVIYEKKI
ncbi:GNAT family N-acetyltransferase [Clostridium senegalense]|uniref:GNAT family N-acetyltransferase n=1 Tax=Clostridium senegalense TaxID=1465809 RepID=UPI0002F759B0|nr:GNAT family N-acetyltransferase [Clostridium senegalense]